MASDSRSNDTRTYGDQTIFKGGVKTDGGAAQAARSIIERYGASRDKADTIINHAQIAGEIAGILIQVNRAYDQVMKNQGNASSAGGGASTGTGAGG